MARLPSEKYLLQEIGGYIVIFEDYTEREVVKFPTTDANSFAIGQKAIYDSEELGPEDKAFAHFWSGYFYANMSSYSAVTNFPLPDYSVQPTREDDDYESGNDESWSAGPEQTETTPPR